jgi:hypothetical protein
MCNQDALGTRDCIAATLRLNTRLPGHGPNDKRTGGDDWSFRLVMSRGLALAAFGIVIGLAGAAAVGRTLTALLYEIGPYDTPSFLVVAGGLLAVAAAACWLPPRHSSRWRRRSGRNNRKVGTVPILSRAA